MEILPQLDPKFSIRTKKANEQGKVLRYVGQIEKINAKYQL